MNRKLIFTLCVIIATVACRKDKTEVVPAKPVVVASSNNINPHSAYKTTDDSTVTSLFINKNVANEMIGSYIYSLGTVQGCGVNDLKSFSIDADSLRAYLADGKIKNVKISFGHTMAYIAAGHSGQYSGMQSGALTIIVSGYDSAGTYIYHENAVLDHAVPCPYSCGIGQSASDLLE